MSDPTRRLKRFHNRLSTTLDAQTVANQMIGLDLDLEGLTNRNLEEITSSRDKPSRAASKLMHVVRNRPELYPVFVRAIDETGQQHVHELLVTGNSEGMKTSDADYVT